VLEYLRKIGVCELYWKNRQYFNNAHAQMSRVKMAEADDDSVVVSESGNTEETSDYPSTNCEDI